MSNYINFKGIKSDTLKGLLIRELSPITKPQVRIETTEIDGRDGDIIDEKGYGAYDKTIQIGLTYGYNIDEIIKYFSGSGDLILSNEPDKVYKAIITSQINYERLIRFRIADVVFHVQPFKYLLNEEVIDTDITNQKQVEVMNVGLEISKPILTLYGTGNIEISINNVRVFNINIDDEYVIVDSLEENAYKETVLKNRNMSGNFPTFDVGKNIITWTGNLTKIKIDPKSRWL